MLDTADIVRDRDFSTVTLVAGLATVRLLKLHYSVHEPSDLLLACVVVLFLLKAHADICCPLQSLNLPVQEFLNFLLEALQRGGSV
jgi:hypothetical protein